MFLYVFTPEGKTILDPHMYDHLDLIDTGFKYFHSHRAGDGIGIPLFVQLPKHANKPQFKAIGNNACTLYHLLLAFIGCFILKWTVNGSMHN